MVNWLQIGVKRLLQQNTITKRKEPKIKKVSFRLVPSVNLNISLVTGKTFNVPHYMMCAVIRNNKTLPR